MLEGPIATTRCHGSAAAFADGDGIDVLDMSASTNPYGPTPAMLDAIRHAAVGTYPSSDAREVRRAIAVRFDVDPARLVVGNGASELLWTFVRSVMSSQSRVLIVEPAFCEFRLACAAAGCPIIDWQTSRHASFDVDVVAVTRRCHEANVDAVYLCSPTSPAGRGVDIEAVHELARARPQTHIVLDESFLSLSHRWRDAGTALPPNVVRVRSWTKDHAVPGVRIGYAIGTPGVVAAMESGRPAWTTSSFAQAAAMAALEAEAFVSSSRERLLVATAELTRAIAGLGMSVVPSQTGYFLVAVDDAVRWQRQLFERHRVLVRDCTSFGLPQHIRISTRRPDDNTALLVALRRECANLDGVT